MSDTCVVRHRHMSLEGGPPSSGRSVRGGGGEVGGGGLLRTATMPPPPPALQDGSNLGDEERPQGGPCSHPPPPTPPPPHAPLPTTFTAGPCSRPTAAAAAHIALLQEAHRSPLHPPLPTSEEATLW